MRALAWISEFINTAKDRQHDEKGAAFTEYVVLLAGIVGVVTVVLFAGLIPALNGAIAGVIDALTP